MDNLFPVTLISGLILDLVVNCSGIVPILPLPPSQITGMYDGRFFSVNFSGVRPLGKGEKVCGVYAISGLLRPLGEKTALYIGSSVDCNFRFYEHYLKINRLTHYNKYLQRAINKDNKNNFCKLLLEETQENNKFTREQNWIDYYNSLKLKHKALFNMSIVSCGNRQSYKKYIVTFPDNHEEIIENLRKFCRNYNLSYYSMINISYGRMESHKSFKVRYLEDEKQRYVSRRWVYKNNINCIKANIENKSRKYKITFPDGTVKEIKNLTEFCKNHNLTRRLVLHVLNGTREFHKGFKFKRIDEKVNTGFCNKIGKQYIITLPNKIEIFIENLAKYCRENNLNENKFHIIMGNNKRYHKNHQIRYK